MKGTNGRIANKDFKDIESIGHESLGHDGFLERAIGHQLRTLRKQHGLTATDLAKVANVSVPMISKIENGLTSPSLGTLFRLANALNISITGLFRQFEQYSSLSFVKSGKGLSIERSGSKAGHEYRLLGYGVHMDVVMDPYLVTLTEKTEIISMFQHKGVEFIYILGGSLSYRVGKNIYKMEEGDSLFFDSSIPHGPEVVYDFPTKMLAILCRSSD